LRWAQPWFRGEYHMLEGSIFDMDNEDAPRYSFAGNWKRQVSCTDNETGVCWLACTHIRIHT
jgi:hypothetical protein